MQPKQQHSSEPPQQRKAVLVANVLSKAEKLNVLHLLVEGNSTQYNKSSAGKDWE